MALKWLLSFLLVVELAAVRPLHDMKHLEVHEGSTEGKPCCGCKLSGGLLGFGKKCEGTIGNYDYETCGGHDRANSCERRFKSHGDEYSCWTKTKGHSCKEPDSLP